MKSQEFKQLKEEMEERLQNDLKYITTIRIKIVANPKDKSLLKELKIAKQRLKQTFISQAKLSISYFVDNPDID